MENEHVLGGLTRKHAEIAGNIQRQQLALRKLVLELDAIDAAIRIFDPQADISAIKPSHYPRKHAAFRSEMMRFVMDAFRTAQGRLVTTREIALNVAAGRGLNADDAELSDMAALHSRCQQLYTGCDSFTPETTAWQRHRNGNDGLLGI